MFEIKLTVSEDLQSVSLQLPDNPQSISTAELTDIIPLLARVRAGLNPPHEAVDLTPDTQVSIIPAVRYQVSESDLPGYARLNILHPGFGWLSIHLDQAAFDKIATDARMFLRAPRGVQ